MRLRSILTIVLACVAMLLLVPRAMAQAELPAPIVEKGVLAEDDKQAIDKFVQQRLPDLSNSDPAAMKKGRDELLRPFRNPLISVAVRQYISDKVKDELKKNAGGKDLFAVNALRIAGEIATSDTSALLESHLTNANEAIRYAAVSGIERTMDAVGNRNPAITPERVFGLVGKLGEVIVDPKSSAEVIDVGVRALKRATDINRPGFDIRPVAIRSLAGAIGKLCERVDAPSKQLLRAGQFIRDALTNNDPSKQLQGDSVTQAATMAGQLLSWCSCQIKKGRLSIGNAEARQDAVQIAKVAESAIRLAGDRVNKPNLAPPLADEFAKATAEGDRDFYKNLLVILRPLNAAPFNINADTFLQCK